MDRHLSSLFQRLAPALLVLTVGCGGDDAQVDVDTSSSVEGETSTEVADPCAGVVCDAPPAPVCSDAATLELFASPGRCEDGACAYAKVATTCERGCVDGACAGDPCAGIVCDTPPNACSAATGVCQSGVCSYAPLTGAACDDGDACTVSDRCAANATCAGVALRCDDSPAATCADGATLTAYAETGTCADGACAYEAVAVTCGGGCANGACAEDPCVGVVCDAPPSACHEAAGSCVDGVCRYAFDDGASCNDGDTCSTNDRCQAGVCSGEGVVCDTPGAATCSDGNTLRVPTAPGSCGAGQCSYGTVDVACSFGCVGGACAGDPCAGVVCDSPEAPTCTGPKTLRAAKPAGTCTSGSCVYETTSTTCLHGCAAGACTPPVGVVISEVLYDSVGHPDLEAFIELHGPPGTPVDGLTLVGVNGNGGADYTTVVLSGHLDSAGLYVVAHPDGDAALVADITDPDVDLQNSPDSVQLRFGTTVLDALAYGTFGAGAIAAGEGAPAKVTPVGESLQRDVDYTDTNVNLVDFVVAAPSPGLPFVDRRCDVVLNPGCDCIDGATQPCGEDRGACEPGSETCSGGAWGACLGGVGPDTEVCDGAVDEDCDGDTDEGCNSNDPFDVGACSGTPLTQAEAMTRLNGASRVVLATAVVQQRTRACGDCAWGPGSDWIIQYLTYSGGVTTRWKPLLTRMNLVLFLDQGTPKLSLQHDTFAGSEYTDLDGMVYGLSPTPILYAHVRAWNHSPTGSDYIELDYTVKDGALVLGADCARWTANPYGQGQGPYTEGFAARFGW